jgi:ketosteroid isomerase-like protein
MPQAHSSMRYLVEVVRADATNGAVDTMTNQSHPENGRLDPGLGAIISERRQLIATGDLRQPGAGGFDAACRQLASSARRRIHASQPPSSPTAQQADVVRNFKQAWEAKDIEALLGLLDPDATAIADGGGLVSAVLRPIEGGAQIARAAVDLRGSVPNLKLLERTVNGQPGLVAQQDGVTVMVMAFDIAGDRIKHIWAVRNPEKLRPWKAG